jgi:hypothetical protein
MPSRGFAECSIERVRSAPVDFTERANLPFPVWASAPPPGPQSLGAFLEATSPASGMAYVVLQHLSADHESQMVEVLARHTPCRARTGFSPAMATLG